MYDRCRSGVIGVDHERIDFYRRREKKGYCHMTIKHWNPCKFLLKFYNFLESIKFLYHTLEYHF